MQIGQRVVANKMANDSFYKKVSGVITGFKNGYVEINADMVIDKWSNVWEKHPTTCRTSAKMENVVLA